MRKRKRKQPSLEQELKRLASEKIKKDAKGRTRAELLASTLWNKSLAGDRDSLRMLLERLPATAVPEQDETAAPQETGTPYGRKKGHNTAKITRARELAKRCVGLKGDLDLRSDARGAPINRAFADVPQEQPELHPEPGFENEVHAFNLFGFLSRSQVTWNPSFTSVVKYSFMCPTTEEHILPIVHGNDRVEWFFQMCDEIHWNVGTKDTAEPRARVIMKAGDMAAMPADCRHQGFSPKRSMLLVWENGSPQVVHDIENGLSPVNPVSF